jgi:2'-5' RNA ligase
VRTLWVGIEPNAELEALYDRVESALVRAGLEPEGRKFSAHVTMARLKNVAVGKVADWLAMGAQFYAPPVRVDRFTLLSSFLSRGGAIYSTVQEFKFGRDRPGGATASPAPAGPFASGTPG